MQILKVKTNETAKSPIAIALKDFNLVVGTGGIAKTDGYVLYGIEPYSAPDVRDAFLKALLPFATAAGVADTLEELAEFWEDPDMLILLNKSDFSVLKEYLHE